MSEFMELFGEWGLHEDGTERVLIVETFQGTGRAGAVFAAPVELRGLPIMFGSTLVRDADGNERTSTATVYAEHGATADKLAMGSRVKLEDGRTATVLMVSDPDAYGLGGFRVVNLS